MPPSRRRSGAPSASRRPKVAGIRNRPHDQEADAPEHGADTDQPPTDSAAAATDDGVARPVIGQEDGADHSPERATEATATMSKISTAAEAVESGAPDAPSRGGSENPAAAAEVWLRTEPAASGAGRPGLFSRDFALPIVLVSLAAVLAGLAGWFGWEAHALSVAGNTENSALVDAGATSEVNGQVSAAVEKVFSYSFADTAATENAAKQVLAGKAADQYNQLFAQIKQQAPAQKLVVTVKVVTSGVKMLQDNRAQVLLFLDQTATRTDANQTNSGAAQLTVNAEKRGGNWVITDLNMR